MIVTGPSLTSSTAMYAPKTPVSTGMPRSDLLAERFVERFGLVSWRRAGEVRSSSLLVPAIRNQRELAHDESRPAYVAQAAIERSGVTVEDPQPDHLRGEPFRPVAVVPSLNAQQDDEAALDLSAQFAANGHPSPGDPLTHGAHSPRIISVWRGAESSIRQAALFRLAALCKLSTGSSLQI